MLGLDTCLAEVMAIPGALDAMLVDHTSGMAVVASGADDTDTERSAAALTEALRATADGLARSSPGESVRIDDMLVTTDKGHHLFRPLQTAFEGPLVIYVRLDLELSNLALARYRLRDISGRLLA
ncbi:roadblock/LC7 domain-containing protein [Nonomuraea sp. NN258]|uniref:roadblock/LC7 domain-containing protein n=1 Tax=Nonomuraea antri TaxID=2730852 RepID=UPI001567E115|nr:roadblock/LC7 domain-containing protein [Nonomuraea antri]NRQ33850.1 roadblock/LC7 domain-containing protein [Nonomuraea antri]